MRKLSIGTALRSHDPQFRRPVLIRNSKGDAALLRFGSKCDSPFSP